MLIGEPGADEDGLGLPSSAAQAGCSVRCSRKQNWMKTKTFTSAT